MNRVAFYILGQPGSHARLGYACRLAEKAYKLRHKVHIHAPDAATVVELDSLLWTFRDGSFVPHDRMDSSTLTDAPVTIGCGDQLPSERDLLINLSDGIPEFAGTFSRVAELVAGDAASKASGRQRYATYRNTGCELEYHEIT
jgi:DNA polymerase-3 subunit chi